MGAVRNTPPAPSDTLLTAVRRLARAREAMGAYLDTRYEYAERHGGELSLDFFHPTIVEVNAATDDLDRAMAEDAAAK